MIDPIKLIAGLITTILAVLTFILNWPNMAKRYKDITKRNFTDDLASRYLGPFIGFSIRITVTLVLLFGMLDFAFQITNYYKWSGTIASAILGLWSIQTAALHLKIDTPMKRLFFILSILGGFLVLIAIEIPFLAR